MLCLALPSTVAAQETRLTIMVFQGMQNLPILMGQAMGTFAKRGIGLDVHLVEHQKVDSIIFMGGDHAFNSLLVQSHINSYEDLRGKVGVDATNTAYAFQLYAMLRQKGIKPGEYSMRSVGSSARLPAERYLDLSCHQRALAGL